MSERLRIIVLGYVVRGPLGGLAWHHLQYVLGLHRLGHDVWFLEDSDDYPSCYDPRSDATTADPSYGLGFADRAFRRLGLGDRWAFHDAHAGTWLGPCAARAPTLCADADCLLNLSGVNPLRDWGSAVPARALVDTDPLFTQVRHLTDPAARERALRHNAFFTFGQNIPAGMSAVPEDGFPWQPTRQPVALEEWPVIQGRQDAPFTCVMQWESYPPVEFDGARYGMKSDSFVELLDLARAVGDPFELALGSPGAPRSLLAERGWKVRDPREATRDPWSYQSYIRASKAEFGVAKHGYVASRTGWFSERSTSYLASGRPVLVEDTGFSEWLPAGEGVVPFETLDDAVAGAREIDRGYLRHAAAARAVAEEHFDARRVLSELLERLAVTSGAV